MYIDKSANLDYTGKIYEQVVYPQMITKEIYFIVQYKKKLKNSTGMLYSKEYKKNAETYALETFNCLPQ